MTRPDSPHLTLMLGVLAQLIVLTATTPAMADARIEQVSFDPAQVVIIRGEKNVQTMVEFAPGERIENIALGNAAGWQVTPNKRGNMLFLKPLAARARTNMTVVTDQRRYLFDLVNCGSRARPVYVLQFTFPEQLVLGFAATQKAPPQQLEATSLPQMATPPPQAPSRNTAWRATGASQLFPAEISDDGINTYLTWSPARDLPAILSTGGDGQEGPVNFTVRDSTVVIEGVAPRYALRIGKASATLTRLVPPSGETPIKSGEHVR